MGTMTAKQYDVAVPGATGAGKEAVEELTQKTIALFKQREINVEDHPQRIAFNLLPQTD